MRAMSLRDPRDELSAELDALGQKFGREAEARTRRVLVEVVRWLRVAGHGDVRLSAVNHTLGQKFRIDSIVSVGGERQQT